MILKFAALAATAASAQPLANPAMFSRNGGTGVGAVVVGSVGALVVFFVAKNIGDELRWRKGKSVIGHACVAAGAVAGAALFYAVVFKL